MPAESRTLGRAALLNMLLRYRAPRYCLLPGRDEADEGVSELPRRRPGKEPSDEDLILQRLVWQSGCHGILTSNYDLLLEHAHSRLEKGGALRSYRYTADLLRYILSNRRFILHLHGDINDIATMQCHPSHAWSTGIFADQEGPGTDLKRRLDREAQP
jgi:NAD-dependent SIR2 family protein deacetylase